ncbi:hypothetical protein OEJ84_22950 (plasmid) [Bacillus subtilis]|uniref:hypothetical protein n=1 Tax=Bacillus subtilis TaxID=1423 RepID=UPI002938E37F|nr:hypothetical protein [Bacillus subtilis]WOF32986.1 hypothetical protein OEJ84_22950 [Bacillus subtilis]
MDKRCIIENCNNNVLAKGFCSKHYKQMYRHGKILSRTIYDKNEIITHENYAEMKLYNNKGMYVASTLIDLEDVEKVSKHKWHLNDNGYVRSKKINEYLHRYVLGTQSKDVDHIYNDSLDNRKENLRECEHYENNRNTPKVNSNTSIKGVYRRCDSYYGSINSQGVKYTSKRFNEISEAIAWREMMELYLHGEFSPKYIYLLDKYGEINDDQFQSLISYKSNYNMKGR